MTMRKIIVEALLTYFAIGTIFMILFTFKTPLGKLTLNITNRRTGEKLKTNNLKLELIKILCCLYWPYLIHLLIKSSPNNEE